MEAPPANCCTSTSVGQLGAALGQPAAHRVDVERVLVADRRTRRRSRSLLLLAIALSRAACLRITWSYAARSAQLELVGRARRRVGEDQLVAAVDARRAPPRRCPRGRAGRRATRPPITWPTAVSRALHRVSIRLVRKYDGHTTEQRTSVLRELVARRSR